MPDQDWPTYDPDAEPQEEASELDEDYNEDNEDEDDEGELLGTFTDEVSGDTAKFNADKLAFEEEYGFDHDCHCDEDWASGNLSVVSVCYMGLVNDAMNTLSSKVKELKSKEREIAKLRVALADAGA